MRFGTDSNSRGLISGIILRNERCHKDNDALLVKKPEIELLRDLVQRQSVTPEDAGCQSVLIKRLEACGFD